MKICERKMRKILEHSDRKLMVKIRNIERKLNRPINRGTTSIIEDLEECDGVMYDLGYDVFEDCELISGYK